MVGPSSVPTVLAAGEASVSIRRTSFPPHIVTSAVLRSSAIEGRMANRVAFILFMAVFLGSSVEGVALRGNHVVAKRLVDAGNAHRQDCSDAAV
jgi:hypothetical protein